MPPRNDVARNFSNPTTQVNQLVSSEPEGLQRWLMACWNWATMLAGSCATRPCKI